MREADAARLRGTHRKWAELGLPDQFDYDRLHAIEAVTASTAIEGSTVTFAENLAMLEHGVVPAGRRLDEQLMNLDLSRAYDVAATVADAGDPWTEALIKALNALVMRNTGAARSTLAGEYDETRGDYRLIDVSAGPGGRAYPSWESVPESMAEFVTWLDRAEGELPEDGPAAAYGLSFEAHYRLVSIHPWSDGNGRTARLLMNAIQRRAGLMPLVVPPTLRAEYIGALAEAQERGDSGPFVHLMATVAADAMEAEVATFLASRGPDPDDHPPCASHGPHR